MSDAPAPADDHKVLGEQAAPTTESEQEKTEAVEEFAGFPAKDGQLSMAVKVSSPFRDYYDGPAFSVSAENDTGPFDVLPKMHNFISLLNACELVIRTVSKGDQKIRIAGGMMLVKADKVIVFLDV